MPGYWDYPELALHASHVMQALHHETVQMAVVILAGLQQGTIRTCSPALLRLLLLVGLQVVRQEAVPLLPGQPGRHHPRRIRPVQQAGCSSLHMA